MEPENNNNASFQEMNQQLEAFNNMDEFNDFFLGHNLTLGDGMANDLPYDDESMNFEYKPLPYNGEGSTSQLPVPMSDQGLYLGQVNGCNNQAALELVMDASEDVNKSPVYQNNILNEFKSPVTPLKVIDVYKYPFGKKLILLLEDELLKQNAMEQGLPNVPTQQGRESKNRRPENIARFDAATHYLQHDGYETPQSWGTPDPYTRQKPFHYTIDGELAFGQRFSTAQLTEYLWAHPRRNELTLWIQNTPADSKKRYPVPGKSERCRWDCCPVKDGTIHKGFFRVCFDEKSSWHHQAADLNPFHNAGYIHLFCLEKLLDFPYLCKHLNVRPDTRVLKEGKNKMAITRDHKQMEQIVNDFIVNSLPWEGTLHNQDSTLWYDLTLCSRLTKYHIAHQPKRVSRVRNQRGGNNINIHKGSCDAYALGEQNKEHRKTPARPESKGKRKRSHDQEIEAEAEEEFIPDENLFDEPRSPTKRPSKRPRRASGRVRNMGTGTNI